MPLGHLPFPGALKQEALGVLEKSYLIRPGSAGEKGVAMEEDIWNNLLSLLPLHPNFRSAKYDDALKGMSTTKKDPLRVVSHTGLET